MPGQITQRMSRSRPTWDLRSWVKTPDFWAVTYDLNERLKNDFDQAKIHLPPPQSKVQIIDGRQG